MFKDRAKEYYKEYSRKRRLDPIEREKDNIKQRERRAANPEKYRLINKVSERKRKLKRYGLLQGDYDALLDSQGGCCAICCGSDTGSVKDFHVDHDHLTGKTRGILCHHCNILLGNAKDNTEVLKRAILYLKEYHNEC